MRAEAPSAPVPAGPATGDTARVSERRFRAMGTDGLIVVRGGRPGLVEEAVERISDLEARWSRFRADSEISRLNRAAGRPVTVSVDTFDLIARSVEAWRLTGGRFDPTVAAAVVAAGYDRSFEMLPAQRSGGPAGPPPRPAPGLDGAVLDQKSTTVQLPPGTLFDPGGIGKGFAADLVANELLACGAEGALVDLGGDLAVVGEGPENGRWVIDVEHPEPGRPPLLHVTVGDAGVATSSRLRRRWMVDGEERHHLIDPGTGRPAESPFVTVSVLAGEAWWAEALTKAAFVAGDLGVLTEAFGLALTAGGGVVTTEGLAAVLAAS